MKTAMRSAVRLGGLLLVLGLATAACENPVMVRVRAITEQVLAPDIEVLYSSVALPSGTPLDIGSILVGESKDVSFEIRNKGRGVLRLPTDPPVAWAGSSSLSVTLQPAVTIAPGGSSGFTVRFLPVAAGAADATLTIESNDSDTPLFTFTVNGSASDVPVPDINLRLASTPVPSGGSHPFADTRVQASTDAAFTLENLGTAVLNLTGSPDRVIIAGANPDQFSVQSVLPASLAAGASTGLTIRFSPTSVGSKSASVSVPNDDPDAGERPYVFSVSGKGVTPNIAVKQGTTPLPSGSGIYSFAGVAVGNQGNAVAFIIENTGDAALNLTGSRVALSGAGAARFVVTAAPPASVGAGMTGSFSLAFKPVDFAAQSATVTVTSDDVDTPSYTFTVTGTGIPWVKSYGGSANDFGYSLQATADGGFILAGATATWKAAGYPSDPQSLWIVKLSAGGAVEWQRIYSGSGFDGVQTGATNAVKQTADGGYIVASSSLSFSASYSFWVLKLTSAGDVTWQKSYGGSLADWPRAICQTADGGYAVAGYTSTFGAGSGDVWVLRLDANGAITWQKAFGGTSADQAYDIHQTADGGFIVAGTTQSYGAGGSDGWLLKLASDGALTWAKTYGGTGTDGFGGVLQVGTDYMVAGSTASAVAGGTDAWVLSLNSSGTAIVQKAFGGASTDSFNSIEQTGGDYVLGGTTQTWGAGGDCWLMKLNGLLSPAWQKTYGGGSLEMGWFASPVSSGGFAMSASTPSFGAGSGDAWLLRITPDGSAPAYVGGGASLGQDTAATVTTTGVTGTSSSPTVTTTTATAASTSIVPADTAATVLTQFPP